MPAFRSPLAQLESNALTLNGKTEENLNVGNSSKLNGKSEESLNVDQVDSKHASDFATTNHTHTYTSLDINNSKLLGQDTTLFIYPNKDDTTINENITGDTSGSYVKTIQNDYYGTSDNGHGKTGNTITMYSTESRSYYDNLEVGNWYGTNGVSTEKGVTSSDLIMEISGNGSSGAIDYITNNKVINTYNDAIGTRTITVENGMDPLNNEDDINIPYIKLDREDGSQSIYSIHGYKGVNGSNGINISLDSTYATNAIYSTNATTSLTVSSGSVIDTKRIGTNASDYKGYDLTLNGEIPTIELYDNSYGSGVFASINPYSIEFKGGDSHVKLEAVGGLVNDITNSRVHIHDSTKSYMNYELYNLTSYMGNLSLDTKVELGDTSLLHNIVFDVKQALMSTKGASITVNGTSDNTTQKSLVITYNGVEFGDYRVPFYCGSATTGIEGVVGGDEYYNSGDSTFYKYNGSEWIGLAQSGSFATVGHTHTYNSLDIGYTRINGTPSTYLTFYPDKDTTLLSEELHSNINLGYYGKVLTCNQYNGNTSGHGKSTEETFVYGNDGSSQFEVDRNAYWYNTSNAVIGQTSNINEMEIQGSGNTISYIENYNTVTTVNNAIGTRVLTYDCNINPSYDATNDSLRPFIKMDREDGSYLRLSPITTTFHNTTSEVNITPTHITIGGNEVLKSNFYEIESATLKLNSAYEYGAQFIDSEADNKLSIVNRQYVNVSKHNNGNKVFFTTGNNYGGITVTAVDGNLNGASDLYIDTSSYALDRWTNNNGVIGHIYEEIITNTGNVLGDYKTVGNSVLKVRSNGIGNYCGTTIDATAGGASTIIIYNATQTATITPTSITLNNYVVPKYLGSATEPPESASSEPGSEYYNTGDSKFYKSNGSSWIALN